MSNFVEYTDEEYEYLKSNDKWGKCPACNHALICQDSGDEYGNYACSIKGCTCINNELDHKLKEKKRRLESAIKNLEAAVLRDKAELERLK